MRSKRAAIAVTVAQNVGVVPKSLQPAAVLLQSPQTCQPQRPRRGMLQLRLGECEMVGLLRHYVIALRLQARQLAVIRMARIYPRRRRTARQVVLQPREAVQQLA